jgi:hypothetical protein
MDSPHAIFDHIGPVHRYTEQPNFLSIIAGGKTVGKLFSCRSNVAIAQIRLEVLALSKKIALRVSDASCAWIVSYILYY